MYLKLSTEVVPSIKGVRWLKMAFLYLNICGKSAKHKWYIFTRIFLILFKKKEAEENISIIFFYSKGIFFVYCALGMYSKQGWFMEPGADMDYWVYKGLRNRARYSQPRVQWNLRAPPEVTRCSLKRGFTRI